MNNNNTKRAATQAVAITDSDREQVALAIAGSPIEKRVWAQFDSHVDDVTNAARKALEDLASKGSADRIVAAVVAGAGMNAIVRRLPAKTLAVILKRAGVKVHSHCLSYSVRHTETDQEVDVRVRAALRSAKTVGVGA